MRTILTLFVALFILTSSSVQKDELTLNLKKGGEYFQNTVTVAKISQDLGGQVMEITMKMNSKMSFLVKEVNSEGYDMEANYKSLSMAMEMPQMNMSGSSDDDDTGMMSPILKALKDQPISMMMYKNGKVKEVGNMEELWNSAAESMEGIPDMQREQLKSQIRDAYGEKSIKSGIETATAIYPDKPVKKGDKWTINTRVESSMPLTMSTEYELIDINADFATIKGSATLVTADKDAAVNNNGMDMSFDLTGTMTADIKVDTKTGWIIEAKTIQEMKGKTTVKANAQIPNDMEIPMSIKSETTVTN